MMNRNKVVMQMSFFFVLMIAHLKAKVVLLFLDDEEPVSYGCIFYIVIVSYNWRKIRGG